MRTNLLLVLLVLGGVIPVRSLAADIPPRVVQQATEELRERLQTLHPEVTRFDVSSLGHLPRLPASSGAPVVRIPADLRLSRRVCAWLDFPAAARPMRAVPLWFSVRAYRPVWTVMQPLRPKQILIQSDIAFQEMDVAGLPRTVSRHDSASLWRARRNLVPGHVLRDGDLEPVPPVLSDQTVAVRINEGPVTISLTGIAAQDGQVGQRIQIRNPASNERFHAMVTGNQQVEILSP